MPCCYPELAEAYVIYQVYGVNFYSPEEALDRGTIFPELFRPYTPREDYP